jgi:adenylate cyclase
MAVIRFLPDLKEETAGTDETILEVALRAGIPMIHVCMGNGRCSTCRIRITEGIDNVSPRSIDECKIAEVLSLGRDIRLACQTRIRGDVTVQRLVVDSEDIEVTSLLINQLGSEHAGVEKEVLILMADIRDFTQMTETLLPYDIVHILNRYFHLINEAIERHGGRIINYMGDGFMALFEVRNPEEDALAAVMAGLSMLEIAEKRMQPYVREMFGKDFEIGIGLHHGLVVAGAIGSRDNKRQTVIGDAVNFTSRIESINKKLGTRFLISKAVYSLVHDRIRTRRKYTKSFKGKSGAHTVYEVTGLV